MYLHIGGEEIIRKSSVIGIFDLDKTSQSHVTRGYLAAAEGAGQVVSAAEDIPKSFVVTSESVGGQTVYLSQMNTVTLARRNEDGMKLN